MPPPWPLQANLMAITCHPHGHHITVTWYIYYLCSSLSAVLPAVVVRQRKPYRRKDGTVLYFEGRYTVGTKHLTEGIPNNEISMKIITRVFGLGS